MKKYTTILLTAAAMLAAVVSCSKNLEEKAPEAAVSGEGLMKVVLKADLSEVSRATLEGGVVKWAAGDKIAVHDGTTVREFSLKAGEGTANGTFEGYVADGASALTALFPFEAATWNGASFDYAIPDFQDVASQSIDPQGLIALGTGSVSGGLSFSNAPALLRFTVGAGVTQVIFHTLNGEIIAGNSTSVLVALPGTAGTFEVAINPGTYAGFRAFVTNSGHTYMQESATSLTLAASKGKNMGTLAPANEVIAIATPAELQAFLGGTPALDAYLCKDLDLNAVNLGTLVSYADDFDGQGHILKNWTANAALFGTLSGSISNLTIGDSCTMGDPTSGNFGYLVNELTGSMVSCINEADINVTFADVTSQYVFGSLVGCSNSASAVMTGCVNSGAIDVAFAVPSDAEMQSVFVGGLVGKVGTESTALRMDDCENNGSHFNVDVAAGGATYMRNIYIGGIAGAAGFSAGDSENKTGWAKYYGDFDACVNNADITVTYGGGTGGSFKVGGIIGSSECALIDCLNNGDVTFANNDSVTSSSPAFGGIAGVLYGTANPNASGCENHGALSLSGQFGNGGTAWAYTEGNGGTYYSVAGGCFGCVGDSSSAISDCDNYGAINFTVKGPSGNASRVYMGGVAGRCVASISGCDNLYTTSAQTMSVNTICYAYFGGVAAVVSGGSTLTNCVNNASINMSHAMQKDAGENNPETIGGGVIGSDTGVAAVSNLENTGDLSLTWTGTNNDQVFFGGAIGTVNITGATVSNCTNSGDMTYSGSVEVEENVKVGGIIPRIGVAATVDHCTNSGSVSVQNSKYTAGVLAYEYYATTVSNCSNSGDISYVGNGQETQSIWVGGVFGYCKNAATITGCTNDGNLSASGWARTEANYVGGVYGGGYGTAGSMANCTNNGSITVTSSSLLHCGGVAGAFRGPIQGTVQNGNVTASGVGLSKVGGLVGFYYSGSYTASTTPARNNSITGIVSSDCGASSYTGGVAGVEQYTCTYSDLTINAQVTSAAGNAGALIGGIANVSGGNVARTVTLSNNTYTGTTINGAAIAEGNICGKKGTGSISGFVAP